MAFAVPSLKELNELTAGEASLLLLRVLNTSDLSFFHSLFKTDTLEDILEVTTDLVKMEVEDGIMTPILEGFKEEADQISEEIQNQKDFNRNYKPKLDPEPELRIAEMEREAEKEDPDHV